MPVNAVEGQALANQALATFTDPAGSEKLADYSATIDWGDGTPQGNGGIVGPDVNGVFTVTGNHTYTEEGANTATITIRHDNAAPVQLKSAIAVSDPAVAGKAIVFKATEALGFNNQVVATFTDPGGPEAIADYKATIDWGDGQVTPGQVSPADALGVFTVTGAHTYAEEGAKNVTVTVQHDQAPNAVIASTANVADPSVIGAGANVKATEGQPFAGILLATFTDPAGAEANQDYTANVDWGDGTPGKPDITPGVVNGPDANGNFTVTGNHRYSEEGNYTITVTISHDLALDTIVMSKAAVDDPAVVAQGANVKAAEGQNLTDVMLATFTDPAGAELNADYSATVDWGDGSPGKPDITPAVVNGPDANGNFTVTGNHRYSDEGSYTLQVTISHDQAPSAVVGGTASVADPAVIATAVDFSSVSARNIGPSAFATFTDPAPAGPEAIGDYSATIDWGDGTSGSPDVTPGLITGPDTSGVFTVTGAHLYAVPGTYTVTITIQHDSAPATVVTTTRTVADIGFNFDPNSGTLTIVGDSFTFFQSTAIGPGGSASPPVTTYYFIMDGVVQGYTNAQVQQVSVQGLSAASNATLYTDDSYTGADGFTHQTAETIVLGNGSGRIIQTGGSSGPVTFMTLSGFNHEYAHAGHSQPALIDGTPGVTNTFVSAGHYAYMSSPGAFYYASNAAYVYGYAASAGDIAYQYDGSGASAFVSSGISYSLMLGTDNGQSFFNEAVGFNFNHGIARNPGQDIAIFYDSAYSETYVSTVGYAKLYSQNSAGVLLEFNDATGFAAVQAYSFVGGTDIAYDYAPFYDVVMGFKTPGVTSVI